MDTQHDDRPMAVMAEPDHTHRIAVELEHLHARIGEHQELLLELRQMLTPALGSQPEQFSDEPLEAVRAEMSPVAERVAEAAARVRSSTNEIRSLLNRLEL